MKSKTARASQKRPALFPGTPETQSVVLAASVLALVLIVFVGWVRQVGDFGVETDFYGGYAPRARDILGGTFDTAAYGVVGPLFELVLAAGMALGAAAYPLAKVVSLLATVGTLLVWSGAARRTVGSLAARAVPWLLLLSPVFVRHGYLAATDALYAFLFSAAVLLTVRAATPRGAALAGTAALAAFLTRYQALVLPVFAAVWFLGRRNGGRRLGGFLAVFPLCAVVLAGVLVLAGKELPSPGFLYNIHYEIDEDTVGWDQYLENVKTGRESPVEEVASHFDRVLLQSARNVPRHLRTEILKAAGVPLALLALGGWILVLAGRSGSGGGGGGGKGSAPRTDDGSPSPGSTAARGDMLRLGALWLIQFGSLLPVQASERYALTQVPLYALAGSVAVGWWLARTRPFRRWRRWTPVLGIVAAGLVLNAVSQVRYQDRQPRYLLSIARDARHRVTPGSTLMARKPQLAYLLDAEWVFFPDVPDLAALRERMEERRPDFVFYGRNEVFLRRMLRFLEFPPYRPAGWETVASVTAEGVLYAVHDTFYTTPLAEDDAVLRLLENATLGKDAPPLEAARRLARYMAETGRYGAALAEYRRLVKFTTLTGPEQDLMERCRRALSGAPAGVDSAGGAGR